MRSNTRYSHDTFNGGVSLSSVAVVGDVSVNASIGEYDYWKALIQFSIPQGSYSGATLTFSTSPYPIWPNYPNPYLPPPIRVGLSASGNKQYSIDYTNPIFYSIPIATGVSYRSIDMTWPASFTVSLNAAALADINSAAAPGQWLDLVYAPLDVAPLGTLFNPQVASIENAVLQLTPAVPEPSEWAMLMVGLTVIGFIAGRRKQTIH